jgi:hypothetical protein
MSEIGECYCLCPECNQKLTYIPEFVHIGDKRAIFLCKNPECNLFREELKDHIYMVMGNLDNYGNGPMTKEEYYGPSNPTPSPPETQPDANGEGMEG